MSGFEKEFDSWRTDKDQFQGYVKGALESLHEEIKEMKACHMNCRDELKSGIGSAGNDARRANARIDGMYVKMLGIGAGAGLFGHWILDFLSNMKKLL